MRWIIGIVIATIVIVSAILIVKQGQIHADTAAGSSVTPTVTASVVSTATSSSVDTNPPAPPFLGSL